MLSEKCMPLRVTALIFRGLNQSDSLRNQSRRLRIGLAKDALLRLSSAYIRRKAIMCQITTQGQAQVTTKSTKAWARRLASPSSPIRPAGPSPSQAPCQKALPQSSSGKLHSKGRRAGAITGVSHPSIVCQIQMLLCIVSSTLRSI